MKKQALWEAFKEIARLALFAAVSAVLAWVADKLAGLDPSSTVVVVGTLVLRFADKWKYSLTKANPKLKTEGLAPF